jgi:hypothetical protein
MTCCGNRRALAKNVSADGAWIEYQAVGRGGLSVYGPVTRHHYRFSGPGARVAVDPRDARSIDRVPGLRRVRT